MFRNALKLQFSLRMVIFAFVVAGVLTQLFAPRIRAWWAAVNHQPAEITGFKQAGYWPSYQAMHDHYTSAFVNSEGFGLRRILTFDEPRFRSINIDGQPFRVKKLELISTQGPGQPFAYVSEMMYPTRDRYRNTKKRPLTRLEARAIQQMYHGVNVMVESERDKTRLVGVLRAGKTCIDCHNAEANEVLGAFAYELQPVPQQPADDQLISRLTSAIVRPPALYSGEN